jgi:hypothetical protein
MDASPLLTIRMNCRNPLLKHESGCHEGCGYDPIVCSIGGYCGIKKGPGNMVPAPIRQGTVSGNAFKIRVPPFQ